MLPGRPLIAVATALEAAAVPGASSLAKDAGTTAQPWRIIELPTLDLLITGVGKSNAAAAVAKLYNPARHRYIMSTGIAGALPRTDGQPPVPITHVVAATRSVYADEGVQTPDRFVTLHELGFAPGNFAETGVAPPADLLALIAPHVDASGPIATVSTCSGTNALALEIARRTGAIAEAMEGAAIAHVAHRLGAPFIEVRAISNTTGDRAAQQWSIRPALAALTAVLGRILG
jgi:futalosine hydrolase